MTFMDGFIERVSDSILELKAEGIRVKSVHISPITALALISTSTVSNFRHGTSLGRQNLLMNTVLGPVEVEVEPDIADDIFLLGIR